MDTGDLDRAVDTLERADDLFAEVDRRGDAALWPLVPLGLGEIAARRGDRPGPARCSSRAEHWPPSMGRPALAVAARAMLALHLERRGPAPRWPWPSEAVALAWRGGHALVRPAARRRGPWPRPTWPTGSSTRPPTQAARCVDARPQPAPAGQVPDARAPGSTCTRGRRPTEAVTALDEATTHLPVDGAPICGRSRRCWCWPTPTRNGRRSTWAWPTTAPAPTPPSPGCGTDRPPLRDHARRRAPGRSFTLERRGRSRLGDKGEKLVAEAVRAGDAGLHWETGGRRPLARGGRPRADQEPPHQPDQPRTRPTGSRGLAAAPGRSPLPVRRLRRRGRQSSREHGGSHRRGPTPRSRPAADLL